jgi:hypothetical protein
LIPIKARTRRGGFPLLTSKGGDAVSANELHYLYLVIGAIGLFGVVLAWTDWRSRKP